MMKRLATVYAGSQPEHRVLSNEKYRQWFAQVIYLPELATMDLHEYDGLLIPEGSHHGRLEQSADRILRFLDGGGTLFLFGDQPTAWLPGLNWQFRAAVAPHPGDLIMQNPEHSFHRHMNLEDFWHCHGFFNPPSGAEILVSTADGKTVLYVDTVSTSGTMLVTSLDLMVHVEGFFANSASRRFIDRFLPWAVLEFL